MDGSASIISARPEHLPIPLIRQQPARHAIVCKTEGAHVDKCCPTRTWRCNKMSCFRVGITLFLESASHSIVQIVSSSQVGFDAFGPQTPISPHCFCSVMRVRARSISMFVGWIVCGRFTMQPRIPASQATIVCGEFCPARVPDVGLRHMCIAQKKNTGPRRHGCALLGTGRRQGTRWERRQSSANGQGCALSTSSAWAQGLRLTGCAYGPSPSRWWAGASSEAAPRWAALRKDSRAWVKGRQVNLAPANVRDLNSSAVTGPRLR